MLTHTEYQEKLKKVKTPEDAAAFAQELLAPMLSGLASPAGAEEKVEEAEEKPKKYGKRLSITDIASRANPMMRP